MLQLHLLPLMLASQLMLAFIDGVDVLYAACSLCFLAYGAYWALMPVLCAELFGEQNVNLLGLELWSAVASAHSTSVRVPPATGSSSSPN